MGKLARGVAALASFVGVFAFAAPALAATTVTATVGPIPIPAVPVQVCVNQPDVPINQCVTGPEAQTVTATVVAQVNNPTAVLVPPTITPTTCPAGTQGVALRINSGSVGATVGGSVTLVFNGTPMTVPINQAVLSPNQTLTVFACAGASPGI